MWMNEYEISNATRLITNPPIMVKAARFLNEFCELINSISDGWAYWSYGTKCSYDLQEIVYDKQYVARCESVKPAMKKVLSFLTRCKQTKDTAIVIDFVQRWKKNI